VQDGPARGGSDRRPGVSLLLCIYTFIRAWPLYIIATRVVTGPFTFVKKRGPVSSPAPERHRSMAVPTLTATDRHRPPSVALFGSLSTAYGQLFGLRKNPRTNRCLAKLSVMDIEPMKGSLCFECHGTFEGLPRSQSCGSSLLYAYTCVVGQFTRSVWALNVAGSVDKCF